jgi:hypothetical protein
LDQESWKLLREVTVALPADLRQRLAEGTLDPGDWDYLLDSVTDLASFTEAFTVSDPLGQVPAYLADEFPGFYLTYAEAEGLLDEGD